jgi:2-keto-4-pentenoate hydratase/2-oxohepta-3-ene-1,7-dioic acid hydratase in catechol pathway
VDHADRAHAPAGPPSADRFLKIGDVVEVSSPQIGVLRTHVVAASPLD